MAGTLTISTLSDGTNSTSSTNCIQGSAKAWVNYKGTATVGIRASYNVSSVTYNSTGVYTVNFTNALTDANYSCLTSGAQNTAAGTTIVGMYGDVYTSSAVKVFTLNGALAFTDFLYVNVAIFR